MLRAIHFCCDVLRTLKHKKHIALLHHSACTRTECIDKIEAAKSARTPRERARLTNGWPLALSAAELRNSMSSENTSLAKAPRRFAGSKQSGNARAYVCSLGHWFSFSCVLVLNLRVMVQCLLVRFVVVGRFVHSRHTLASHCICCLVAQPSHSHPHGFHWFCFRRFVCSYLLRTQLRFAGGVCVCFQSVSFESCHPPPLLRVQSPVPSPSHLAAHIA